MATQISDNLNPSNSAQGPRQWLADWLRPRATDRDEAFRERSIRSTLLVVIFFGLLSFASTLFVFNAPWGLISFPSLHIVALTGCFLSAFAITRRYLLAAGWLLSLTVLLGVSGIILLARQQGDVTGIFNGLPAFMFVPVIATLILPRKLVLAFSFFTVVMYGLSYFLIPVNDFQVEGLGLQQEIVTVFMLLMIEGALLRQLRVEFDARLEDMRESMRQTEIARQQAEVARVQAEEDRKRAEEADMAKSQFLANMSHELRTPLNAIIGYAEAMLGGMAGEIPPQQRKLLGHIQHNSRRLLALINDILDLSKIESGSIEVYLAPMSPRKIVRETVESLRSLAGEKNIYLDVNYGEEVPELVLSDANKLQQIVVNLVSNAIKFTETGGVTVDVDADGKSHWRIRVTDTGIGMPQDAVNYIFEPFRQVDGSSTRKHRGTGLGLSITKRLIDKMDGHIEVDSEQGKGSTFTIVLPRAQMPEEAQPLQQV
ncbi:MAG: hypothetical protein CL610_30290 [Anaerolineaceae bacterium]|nr:hypothetical protein [Anaerolineaceae bacterium]